MPVCVCKAQNTIPINCVCHFSVFVLRFVRNSNDIERSATSNLRIWVASQQYVQEKKRKYFALGTARSERYAFVPISSHLALLKKRGLVANWGDFRHKNVSGASKCRSVVHLMQHQTTSTYFACDAKRIGQCTKIAQSPWICQRCSVRWLCNNLTPNKRTRFDTKARLHKR